VIQNTRIDRKVNPLEMLDFSGWKKKIRTWIT
jgi:hypothetical protein